MDYLFPVSGVETNILVPPLVALGISFFTSMAGVSGAFLLLPFQMSVLGYTSPSVSGTNLVFNIVAIPSGVYRYIKEGRMVWPLTLIVVVGTLPGTFAGFWLRVRFLPDPRIFKLFVGLVLFYFGGRLLYGMIPKRASKGDRMAGPEKKFNAVMRENNSQSSRAYLGPPAGPPIKTISLSFLKTEFEFSGERFSFGTPALFAAALVVGVIGGAYGIGGGALIAPFCVAVLGLPVYVVAGAALMGTFITSVAGVSFYSLIPAGEGTATSPDWLLGLLFGAGGFVGMYLGARCQKFVPQNLIKLMLGLVIMFLAIRYIVQFF